MRTIIKIGTRKSALALWQAEYVGSELKRLYPHITVELVHFDTKGDQILEKPLAEIGGKGLFTAELEAAMHNGDIDLAVHSLKDMPTDLPEGLVLGAISKREEPYDALVSPKYKTLDQLPEGARVGTSSLRRQAQLLHVRPDLQISVLRGNVQTRLRKLEDENLDAIVLAQAGLKRLELGERITQTFTADEMIPAVGQGALGYPGLLQGGGRFALDRWLVPNGRCGHDRPRWLYANHRPQQGCDQVRWRVDQLH